MGHEIIRYQPALEGEVAALLTEFWPDPATNAAYFSWLHEQNPYLESPAVYVLVLDGKAVGMRGFHGARWEITGTGETFDAPCGCMFVTHSSVRGRGLAATIMEGATDGLTACGYPYMLSYSATPIPYQSQLRRGWRLVGNYRTIRRETSGTGILRAVARQFPILKTIAQFASEQVSVPVPGQNPFATLDALQPIETDGGTISVSKDADAAAMAGLANAAATPGLFRHVRDPAYFDWRFRNPLMEYRFVYWRDTKLKGFLVLQNPRGAVPAVHIVDWEADNAEILQTLLAFVIESGHLASLSLWSATLSDEMVSFLTDSGFAPIDESQGVEGYAPGLQVKALREGVPDGAWQVAGRSIDDLANWDLRPIYSDSF